MADVREGVEMRATNKNGNVSFQFDSDGDNSGSAKEASAALSQAGHGGTIDSQTRIRVRSFAICIDAAELIGNRGFSGLRRFSLSR
jgi:hypothetical protein